LQGKSTKLRARKGILWKEQQSKKKKQKEEKEYNRTGKETRK
jgi:hypothetical protein